MTIYEMLDTYIFDLIGTDFFTAALITASIIIILKGVKDLC